MLRELRTADAEIYYDLRREALQDAPLAFASSPEDDRAASVEAVREMLRRAPESVVFGAFDHRLIGSIGFYRDHHLKAAHKVHIWGMYVAPEYRRRSVGRALLDAALTHARSLVGVEWVHLSVTEVAEGARRLYENAGFAIWGTEPEALRHEGRSVAEYHMALRL